MLHNICILKLTCISSLNFLNFAEGFPKYVIYMDNNKNSKKKTLTWIIVSIAVLAIIALAIIFELR